MTCSSAVSATPFAAIRKLASSLALIVLLACAATVLAPPRAAVAQSYVFSSVQIQGNQRVEPATILSYVGVARGERVSAGQLNDGYQRLVGTGLFEAVEIIPQGSTLVIKVTEYPTINQISIEGNRKLKDDVLLEVVKSQPRRVYSPALAEQDAAAIIDRYRTIGRLAASVVPKIIRRSENRVDLAFEVTEGKIVEVERLSFVGNRSFSDRRLRRVLGTKQAGILRQIIQSDTYVPERIDFDKQVLRDFYLSRGFIDFQVRSVSREFSREKNSFFLTFQVEEGQPYRFGNLSLVSEVPEAQPVLDEFRRQLKIRSGTTYNPNLVDNVISRMERLALRKGFTFVRVDPRVTKHQREGVVDIEFALVRGERIFVERIDIEGNQTTLDRVIRTQFHTVEGDPFNPREIREASERIRALGFFKTADVQARQGSAADQVVVDVNVEEQNTGSLSLGASYGQDAGLGANIAFSESNFLGRGQGLRLQVATTKDTRSYAFSFSEPNVLGRDLKFSLGLSYNTTQDYNAAYSTKLGAITPSIEFPVSEVSSLALRYQLGYSEIYAVDDGDQNNDGFNDGDTNQNGTIDPGETAAGVNSSFILQQEESQGGQWRSGVGYTFNYDNRVSGLNPRGGALFRFSQDITGLGGDTSYIKTSLKTGVERKVASEEVLLRASVEGGSLYMLNGTSRITDRYLLGSSTMRGFEFGGIGPRDLNTVNKDALGGQYYFVAKLDAEFPLGLPEEYGLTGGAFMDVGSLWGLDNTNGGPAGGMPVDDSMYIRSAVGLSLLWDTPIGPLRLNFSQPLQKKSYDRTQSFDLTVQTSF